ncbi:cell division protein SepF [Corynebacterium sp. 13CS0277]|uniref:cell division protein SepF n=1 Tax=Corynebacterium sp. 13CS0277 TaxID=2071994 RepID=UPI0013047D08|nr:cell division protein SepF [Corynebacterium sp. 13CS0277]
MTMMNYLKDYFGLRPGAYTGPESYAEYEDLVARPEMAPADMIRPATDVVVTVVVDSFRDCPLIGDPFKQGDAVIFDLSNMAYDEAKRVFDFATGLAFGLRGTLRRLDDNVWALMDKNRLFTDNELLKAYRGD